MGYKVAVPMSTTLPDRAALRSACTDLARDAAKEIMRIYAGELGQRAKADTLPDRSEGRAPLPYLCSESPDRDRGLPGSRVRREPFHGQFQERAGAGAGSSDVRFNRILTRS